ncbi:peptidoglycan editing factor PgeF [Janibacter sp. G1551]|uniref:peptidoglycan editing factor PgeF n=1 Tax=Janibacter sp. G1551 TaxID=3420440 RepID=UPI003D019778
MFNWQSRDGVLDRVFTSRVGGHSEPPWSGLNLGGHVGDDPQAVAANRRELADGLGLAADRIVWMDQCHGTDVAVVDAVPGQPPTVDALVTASPDLALAVLVADCTPILLSDTEAGVIGAAHAGRPGMVAGIVPAVVGAMRDLGARDIRAAIGPSVCARCYEVPAEMRDAAALVAPESHAVTWSGTPAIDVAAGVVAQLAGLGIAVEWVPGCTRETAELYSYRRDGQTGRTAGVIVRRSA